MKQNESMQQVIEAIHRLNQAAAMPAAGADIWQMVLERARSNDADHERLMGLLESVLTAKREAAAAIRAELERRAAEAGIDTREVQNE
jgi:hypothetical protein